MKVAVRAKFILIILGVIIFWTISSNYLSDGESLESQSRFQDEYGASQEPNEIAGTELPLVNEWSYKLNKCSPGFVPNIHADHYNNNVKFWNTLTRERIEQLKQEWRRFVLSIPPRKNSYKTGIVYSRYKGLIQLFRNLENNSGIHKAAEEIRLHIANRNLVLWNRFQ
jgi:hypothetical protein